ncbi:hypothetical protein CHS0354_001560 [Potamilus streckersoni]|uniref:Uncharacterized protein n=1 Tax=Potamilus streckersoni TaxID=2493646 RepID=A0AAE0SMP9_9BIVA|nr:hypothetical protein CHS0354_001560 [Potamilus streckersoni]
MTMPGQIGVAVGTAKLKKGLRMKNFRCCLVRCQCQFIKKLYNSLFCLVNETCCRVTLSVDHSNCPENKQECARNADNNDDTDGVQEKDIENESDDDEEVIKTMDILENRMFPKH